MRRKNRLAKQESIHQWVSNWFFWEFGLLIPLEWTIIPVMRNRIVVDIAHILILSNQARNWQAKSNNTPSLCWVGSGPEGFSGTCWPTVKVTVFQPLNRTQLPAAKSHRRNRWGCKQGCLLLPWEEVRTCMKKIHHCTNAMTTVEHGYSVYMLHGEYQLLSLACKWRHIHLEHLNDTRRAPLDR